MKSMFLTLAAVLGIALGGASILTTAANAASFGPYPASAPQPDASK